VGQLPVAAIDKPAGPFSQTRERPPPLQGVKEIWRQGLAGFYFDRLKLFTVFKNDSLASVVFPD